MSTASAILNLGAALVVFVAAASLFLVAWARPEFLEVRLRGRVLLQLAALAVAATAIVQGALPETDPGTAVLAAVRVGSVVAIGVALPSVRYRPARAVLAAGTLFLAGGVVAYTVDADVTGTALQGLAGLGFGTAAAVGARRAIAMRIATFATVLLVVVVLVLSAVLSVVVTGNIADEALSGTEERADIEAGILEQQANEAIGQSDFLSEVLVTSQTFRSSVSSDDFAALQEAIADLRSDYRQVDFISVIDAAGRARVGAGIDQTDFVALSGTSVVQTALAGDGAASVEVLGDDLMALGATPVSLPDERGAPELVAVTVTGFRLDQVFLAERLQEERGTHFSLVTADEVLASTRDPAPESVVDAAGSELAGAVERSVLGGGIGLSEETSVSGTDAFVSVSPVDRSTGEPVAALVVTTESELVEETRQSLFRTLFLVALIAAGLAFVSAVLAGARLTAPVRRLTDAARQVAAGDLGVRADVEAADEIGTLGASFDSMTESIEQMTREIREAAAQTEAILSGMAEGLVATDATGTVVALNPAAEKMLGRKEGSVVGKGVASVIKGDDDAGTPLADRLSEEREAPWTATAHLDRRRGPLAVAMSGSPIRDDAGAVIGRVYVMRDIQREAEVEAMKSEFLANIGHELRTPLTPIKGYAEMMLSKKVPRARQEAFLGAILEGAERLERYVDMLVNFSAMEAGRFELQAEELDVREVIERVGERWDSRIEGHRVDVHSSSRVPKVVADKRLLERALHELVDNAVKYSPEGGTIRLDARTRGTGASRRVEISVADDGIGIEQSDLDGIFSDFAQLDGSSTRRYGGLGLGLSFVHRVVTAHHGTLDAESEPGEGSVFTILLPPATRTKPSKPSKPSQPSKPKAKQKAKQKAKASKRSRTTAKGGRR